MTNRTHVAAAVTCSLAYFKLFGIEYTISREIAALTVAAVASELPDIDSPYSRYGRMFMFILWPLYLMQKITRRIAPKIFYWIKHKGILHWISSWAAVLIPLELVFTGTEIEWIINGVTIGIGTHLLCDYLAEGIYPYAPFINKKKKFILSIKTGGIIENIFTYILLIYCYVLIRKQ